MGTGVAVGFVSLVLSTCAIYYAFATNGQFYPSVVFMVKTPWIITTFYFQAAVLVYGLFKALLWLFFGQLLSSERLMLWEECWYAVFNTCVMFALFRDDVSHKFAFQLASLVFIKCFHWLAMERVNTMERSPFINLKFHLRMTGLLVLLACIDVKQVTDCYYAMVLKTGGAEIILGFEYCILLLLWLHVFLTYALHSIDFQLGNTWQNKSICLVYVELVINLVTCFAYICLLVLLVKAHIIPIQLIYPVVSSFKALANVISRLITYRKTLEAMGRFAVVSAADLTSIDATCIICREDMSAASRPLRLPCGHVFHKHCLRGWFQRQQTCPTCRKDVLATPPRTPRGAQQQPPVEQQFFFAQLQHQQIPNQNPAAMNQPPVAGAGAPIPIVPMPFLFPQLPLPPLLPPPPPPCPRAVLDALSEEDLRALEGTTREAVINRILRLREVTNFLEAADVLLEQVLRATTGASAEAAPPVAQNPDAPAPSQQESTAQPTDSRPGSPVVNSPTDANNDSLTRSEDTVPSETDRNEERMWTLRHSPPPFAEHDEEKEETIPPTQQILDTSPGAATVTEPPVAQNPDASALVVEEKEACPPAQQVLLVSPEDTTAVVPPVAQNTVAPLPVVEEEEEVRPPTQQSPSPGRTAKKESRRRAIARIPK